MASLALSVAHSHENEERRAANFHAALSSRETIGEATGILMERERITPEQAFDVLRQASQHLNVKLREVAQNLIDTGEDPDTGQHRSRDREDGRSNRYSRGGSLSSPMAWR
jgi:AmiR/NasT family two-component response regulator